MKKRCSICGRFMHTRLHGACLSCLKSMKKLPPALAALGVIHSTYNGKQYRSIRGILNAINTLILDGDTFCVKWDPVSNLKKVLSTVDERPYLTPEMIGEIQAIVEEVEDETQSLG